MSNEEIEKYKELLLAERDEIIKEIVDTDASAKDLISNDYNTVNDSADEAASQITQNVLNIVSATSRKTLMAIDAAIRRIEENSFGNCISCGDEINNNRLNAIPWATMCIDCKNKNEKRR